MLEQIRQAGADAAKTAAAPVWSLSDTDLIDCIQLVHRWSQQTAALQLRLVQQAVARGLPEADGFRSAAGWLRSRLLLDPRPARELVEQAEAMRRRPVVEQALVDGMVDLRQAAVIAAAVDPISADIPGLDGVRVAAEAEEALIGMASDFPAYQLRRLGERILTYVAPEVAERVDEERLRNQEKRAQAKRFVTWSLPVDGVVRLSGSLSVEDAAVVNAALQPLCTPIRGDDRTAGQRRADALADICRLALRTADLPDHGGEPPQLALTVPFDPLTRALGVSTLDNGARLSAGAARRLACDAKILPLVMGGAGQVLDAGRTRRLATGPLRRALVARDRGCAHPDCDRPPRWCDSHHLIPWSANGRTCLTNLVLLCPHHHRVIHDPDSGWRVRLADDGLPEFIPPPWTDPAQRPRRNRYHPRT
jgi:hypothetical protein